MNGDKMKFVILLAIIILAGLFPPAEAVCELVLSVEPDTTLLDLSCEFELCFYTGEDIVDLMGYNVLFSFDPDYLQVISVDEGPLPADSGEETFFQYDSSVNDSTIEVNGAVLGEVIQTPGCIFSVTFRALKSGVTLIMIKESDLRDDSNAQIPHSDEGGLVIIAPEVGLEECSWGKVKNIFR